MSRRSRIAALVAGSVAVVAVGAVVRASIGDEAPSVAPPPVSVPASACGAPASSAAVPPPSGSAATVAAIPGATPIDMGGLLPTKVAEAADGSAWALVGRTDQPAAIGRVARIDVSDARVTGVTTVVAGCDASTVTAVGDRIWVGTCNALAPSGVASGAELVEIDAATGALGRRVALETPCVDAVVTDGAALWASGSPRVGEQQRVWRVDAASGVVDEPVTLAIGESLSSGAVTGELLWTARTGPAGRRLVGSDTVSGTERVSIPVGDVEVLGGMGDALWTIEGGGAALEARDPTTGDIRFTIAVLDVRAAAASASGIWLEHANGGSLEISLGRVGPGKAGEQVLTTFRGAGPDRTGMPYLGTLSATASGAWLTVQDRLFLILGEAVVAPAPATTSSAPLPTSTTSTTGSLPDDGG